MASLERLGEANKSHTSWRCWFWVGDHLFVFFLTAWPLVKPSISDVGEQKESQAINVRNTQLRHSLFHHNLACHHDRKPEQCFFCLWHRGKKSTELSKAVTCIKLEYIWYNKTSSKGPGYSNPHDFCIIIWRSRKGPRITIVTCLWAMCDIFFKTCLDCQPFDWFSIIASIKLMQLQILSCSAVTFARLCPANLLDCGSLHQNADWTNSIP